MATSGSFNTSAVNSFYFTVGWTRTGYSSVNNEHYIYYEVVAHNTAGNYRTVYLKSLTINSTSQYYSTSAQTCYDGTVITSGNITIPSYNSAGDAYLSIAYEAGVGISSGSNSSGSGYWDLDRIPRYLDNLYQSQRSKTVNSISINWSCSPARDWTQYSVNGGSWKDAYDIVASNNMSGYYTISNLQPNTTYSIRTRCRRQDSGLWTETGAMSITTYDIAKISTANNFNLGSNETITYSNPSSATIAVAIYKTDGSTPIRTYQSASGSSYTFTFTDAELDTLYKMYGENTTISVRFYIRTTANGVNYWNYKTTTITLTGNQKTGHINVSGSWKRTKKWVNVEGTWKRCVRWVNAGGTWKRCI